MTKSILDAKIAALTNRRAAMVIEIERDTARFNAEINGKTQRLHEIDQILHILEGAPAPQSSRQPPGGVEKAILAALGGNELCSIDTIAKRSELKSASVRVAAARMAKAGKLRTQSGAGGYHYGLPDKAKAAE